MGYTVIMCFCWFMPPTCLCRGWKLSWKDCYKNQAPQKQSEQPLMVENLVSQYGGSMENVDRVCYQ